MNVGHLNNTPQESNINTKPSEKRNRMNKKGFQEFTPNQVNLCSSTPFLASIREPLVHQSPGSSGGAYSTLRKTLLHILKSEREQEQREAKGEKNM